MSKPQLNAKALDLCASCIATALILLAAVVASFVYLDLSLSQLFTRQSMSDVGGFFASFFPPDFSPDFLRKVGIGTLETLALSAIGTLLAMLAALLLAVPTAGWMGSVPQKICRFGLNALRSVPELVWATLMVLAAGLGPFAGALALALHTTGVLGRLFAESLENVSAAPRQALHESGVSVFPAFFYGTWPLVLPQVLAYTLYRWEMNIRMAAILGFVGAGGLGQLLYFELSLFHQAQACTVILAMLVLTVLVDAASGYVRRRVSVN